MPPPLRQFLQRLRAQVFVGQLDGRLLTPEQIRDGAGYVS